MFPTFCSIPTNNSRKHNKNFFLILLTLLSLYTQNAFITAIALNKDSFIVLYEHNKHKELLKTSYIVLALIVNVLRMYKECITELTQEGILNESSMKILSKLKEKIGISDFEHQRVIAQIKQKYQDLFDETLIQKALKNYLETDEVYLKSLQLQFNISDNIHDKRCSL